MTNTTTTIHEIGTGSCGRVYDLNGSIALKRARPGQGENLWNDFLMHIKILSALRSKAGRTIDVLVPEAKGFLTETNEALWAQLEGEALRDGGGFDEGMPRMGLLSERILPVEREVREALVGAFCSEAQREDVRRKRENEDCLVRVCLGEVDAQEEGRASKSVLRRAGTLQTTFSLRNFPLTLSKLDRAPDALLDPLTPTHLARNIAETLALLHWTAQCDARDVEFVIGGKGTLSNSAPHCHPPSYEELAALPGPTSTITPLFMAAYRRPLHLWLLDFNQVKLITMDEQGVDKAVSAFFDNKPKYYPRPYSGNEKMEALWKVFKEAYLAKSEDLTDTKLPQMFIDKVEEKQKSRMG
ncbi:hypothetical protein PRZ48_009986 [Zasmidium cellare]|uniref:DUF3669 domain-containing protein n=1 Tax=Zasmidium cellare TaxID=395010 RepID=A0ABR0ED93_ZASCE|nr:hypothetical protein PRZ48_009986 [Zasmidium cellare]